MLRETQKPLRMRAAHMHAHSSPRGLPRAEVIRRSARAVGHAQEVCERRERREGAEHCGALDVGVGAWGLSGAWRRGLTFEPRTLWLERGGTAGGFLKSTVASLLDSIAR